MDKKEKENTKQGAEGKIKERYSNVSVTLLLSAYIDG